MKRYTIAIAVVPIVVIASTLVHDLRLNESMLRFARLDSFDIVEIDYGHLSPDPGKPSLPDLNVTILIPADAKVTMVTVQSLDSTDIPGEYNISPAQQPRPVGQPPTLATRKLAAIYESDEPYPGRLLKYHGTGNAAGFRVLTVTLSPLQYRPLSGRLLLHTHLQVTADFEQTGDRMVLTPAQLRIAGMSLAPLVANPVDLAKFSPVSAEPDLPEATLLVVTADRLTELVRPVADYKTRRGFRTEIRTVEWAQRNYPGRDVQECLRNMIRDFFEHRGTSFVLLAGDNAEVPCRRIRLNIDEEADIPTDLYYADLDYSWDSNGNNLFGEMEDSVDLYADVLIGRVSVQNTGEVQTFLDKVTKYETSPATDYIKRSLLPSGWLWRSLGYHGRFMNDSIANITPSPWVDRSLINPPGASVVRDSFEHGFALFNPAGHGNATGIYDEDGTPIYTTGVARTQHNDRRYTISTSLACNPGDFESEDCLAEVTHNCPGGGSIAVMMNSRYGWGTPPHIGPSELLCIRFYDFMLRRNATNLAACHDRSREVYALSARHSTLWRWCMTEFNLFGDPTLDMWTDLPVPLTVQAPESIPTGRTLLRVTVHSGTAPVSNARVCAWMAPDVYAVGLTGANGQAELEIHPYSTGTLSLAASCPNCLPATADIRVVSGHPEPHIVLSSFLVDDEGSPEPNGILEPGENGRLTLVLRNNGAAAATDASILLRPSSTGIRLSDSTAYIGTILPLDSVAISEITVTALPGVLPGSSPEVTGIVSAIEGTWEISFAVHIGYPGRTTAEIDTGRCALTLTSRGLIGFDLEGQRSGRGFRFPDIDTSCLNTASFCLTTAADYVVDRFYSQSRGTDRDWKLVDSIRQILPKWGENQTLRSGFSDAGHTSARNVYVRQYGLGLADSILDGCVILVFDIINNSSDLLTHAYAGIIADFDIKATDRLHDIARTTPGLQTAYMRNVTLPDRVAGVKLLAPTAPAYLACVDHALYVYPDSGMTELMKYRILTGQLGSANSDRPFNWSVCVATGPFDIPGNGGRQRVALALVAAQDSSSYHDACRACQVWYDTHVGIADVELTQHSPSAVGISPNPFRRTLHIRPNIAIPTRISIRAYNHAGRLLSTIYDGAIEPNTTLTWNPDNISAGVYFVRLEGQGVSESHRVILTR